MKKINQLITYLWPTSYFARNVTILAGGTSLGQFIVVLASPIITRLYSPEDLGLLAIFISILSILVVVASLRYELAIPLPDKDEDAANLLVLALFIVVGTSILTCVGVWLLGEYISFWTHTPTLKYYLWLLPFSLFGAGCYQVLNYWAVRKKAFGLIACTKLNQSLWQVLTQLGFGFLKLGPLGLLAGDVLGRIGGGGTLALLALKQNSEELKQISRQNMVRMASRYFRFPQISSISALLNSAGMQLPALILAAFYGPQVAGWFALGQRVIGLPMGLVGQAVSQVYLGEASCLARQDPASIDTLFKKTASRLFLIGVLPITILAIGGPYLFPAIFGANWAEAGVYMRYLSLMFLVQFVVGPLSQTLNILERQDLQLYWDSARLLVVNGGLCLAGSYGLSHVHAISVYGVGMLIMYGVLGIVTLCFLTRRLAKEGKF